MNACVCLECLGDCRRDVSAEYKNGACQVAKMGEHSRHRGIAWAGANRRGTAGSVRRLPRGCWYSKVWKANRGEARGGQDRCEIQRRRTYSPLTPWWGWALGSVYNSPPAPPPQESPPCFWDSKWCPVLSQASRSSSRFWAEGHPYWHCSGCGGTNWRQSRPCGSVAQRRASTENLSPEGRADIHIPARAPTTLKSNHSYKRPGERNQLYSSPSSTKAKLTPWNPVYRVIQHVHEILYSLERSRSVCVGRFLRYIGQSQDTVHYIHMMLFRITLSEVTVVMLVADWY